MALESLQDFGVRPAKDPQSPRTLLVILKLSETGRGLEDDLANLLREALERFDEVEISRHKIDALGKETSRNLSLIVLDF